jgi:hypothetical protein
LLRHPGLWSQVRNLRFRWGIFWQLRRSRHPAEFTFQLQSFFQPTGDILLPTMNEFKRMKGSLCPYDNKERRKIYS